MSLSGQGRIGERWPSQTRPAIEKLRRHIEGRLALAEVDDSPFPHLIIEDFFPADVYAGVLNSNPFGINQGREWLPREESNNVSAKTPYFARKHLDFDSPDSFVTAQGVGNVWSRIRDCFLSDNWFEKLIAGKYASYFSIRFGDLVHDEEFFSLLTKRLFLQRHEPGFLIGPHTDLPTRIFTCIFSFADREGFEEYGTQLLSHKDRLVRCWGNDHYEPDDFIVRKIAPYRPNNFLLFFKTRHSFHAVKAIDEWVPNQRFGMQFQLHEPSHGLFNDLSAPQLMHFPPRSSHS